MARWAQWSVTEPCVETGEDQRTLGRVEEPRKWEQPSKAWWVGAAGRIRWPWPAWVYVIAGTATLGPEAMAKGGGSLAVKASKVLEKFGITYCRDVRKEKEPQQNEKGPCCET